MRCFIVLVMLSLVAFNSQADVFYRYTNADGVTSISPFISPQDAIRGYQVVDEKGWVVEEVPPALSAEAREAQAIQKHLDNIRNLRDAELMKLYSSPDNVDRALKNAVTRINVSRNIKKSIIANRRLRLVKAQGEAANHERGQREVPVELLTQMQDIKDEIIALENGIKILNSEQAAIAEEFDRDRTRVSFLIAREKAKYQSLIQGKGDLIPQLENAQSMLELELIFPEHEGVKSTSVSE
jgi:hypothetical protein